MCLKDGQVVHERKPKKYASACAETGTVIGIYIYLPEREMPAEELPTEPRDKFWWKNSGKEYYLVDSPAHPRALGSSPSCSTPRDETSRLRAYLPASANSIFRRRRGGGEAAPELTAD